MAGPRIPLIVIGGFLGAGKTTLLNRWLAETDGRRLAVLVDASVAAAQSKDPRLADTMARQLASADELSSARAWAAAHAPGAPRLETVESRLPIAGLLASSHAGVSHIHGAACGHGHGHDHVQHAAQFESVALHPSAAWSPEALRDLLARQRPRRAARCSSRSGCAESCRASRCVRISARKRTPPPDEGNRFRSV